MLYPVGTTVHCNRCDKAFPLTRPRMGFEFNGTNQSTRLTEFDTCPHCGMTDTHWLYARDYQPPAPDADTSLNPKD